MTLPAVYTHNSMSTEYHARLFLVILLHLLPSITAAIKNLQPYTPTDLILLNCGSPSTATSLDGRKWDGDSNSKFLSSNSETDSSSFTASQQDPTIPQVPFMTARMFQSKFTYSFPVSPGPKFVRLYFYPATYSNLDISKSFFSLTVNNYSLLSNFSASLAVKPAAASFIKEYIINVRETEKLDLTFSPSPASFAFVNGIEIISMPNNLYTSADDTLLGSVGMDNNPFYLHNTTALETCYRLNVGGNFIGGSDDTGMYRSWHQDSDYIFGAAVGVGLFPSDVEVKYTIRTPAFTAPVSVYETMRSMGNNNQINENYNLSWYFSIDAGFNYLVRLHFCEIRKEVEFVNQVVFFIFINNQTAEDDADVVSWSGGNSVPVYKDYVVWVPIGSHPKQDLWLSLHPNIKLDPQYLDAFLNGLEIFKLNNSDGSLAGSNPEPTVDSPAEQNPRLRDSTKRKDSSKVMIVIGPVFGGIFTVSLILCLLIHQKKSKKDCRTREQKSLWLPNFYTSSSIATTIALSLPTDRCRRFTLVEIKAATRNFDDQNFVGSGGFGNVYKGCIESGSFPAAIKRLDSSSKQGTQEFETEIEMLSHLRHVNLVSLIGYCTDEGEMILVYDYMINGTLRDHLYNTNNDPLPWKKRLEICIGAARGLHYLHSELKHKVIHRDVKTTNILLDEEWIAKISDFGLSRVAFNQEVSTQIKGTWGYLDPEYARYQQLSEKSDVYSFGVVLLEVLFARKALNQHLEEEQMNLVIWAHKCVQNGNVYQIIDPYLKGKIAPECMRKFLEIALSCVRNKGIERPTMNDVMGGLEFALELQVAADAEKMVMNPDGEYVYPEASFLDIQCVSAHIVDGPWLDSIGITTFDTSTNKLELDSAAFLSKEKK